MRSGLDAAERFQDWVTNDVLPTIRKTGRYQTEQDAWPPKITGPNGEFLVPVPGPGQYIIIVQKAGNCFIKAATYDQITKEHNLLDAKLIFLAVQSIDAIWSKIKLIVPVLEEPNSGDEFHDLHFAIYHARDLSKRFLANSNS
jgi:hypothetical protein